MTSAIDLDVLKLRAIGGEGFKVLFAFDDSLADAVFIGGITVFNEFVESAIADEFVGLD